MLTDKIKIVFFTNDGLSLYAKVFNDQFQGLILVNMAKDITNDPLWLVSNNKDFKYKNEDHWIVGKAAGDIIKAAEEAATLAYTQQEHIKVMVEYWGNRYVKINKQIAKLMIDSTEINSIWSHWITKELINDAAE